MKQPKFSEVLRAAADGVMAPFGLSQQQLGNFGNSQNAQYSSIGRVFNTDSYDRAKQLSGMLHAIATVYEQYEKAAESS